MTAAVSWQQRLTVSIAWSPNTSRFGAGGFVRNREALAYELAVLQPLNASWSLCAGAGYYDLSHLFGTGYVYWNVGLAFTWGALQVDLLHIGTDADARRLFGSPRTGVEWTAALTWRF